MREYDEAVLKCFLMEKCYNKLIYEYANHIAN